MPGSIVTIRLDDGSEVLAEVEEVSGAFGQASADLGEIDFGKALARVKSAANELIGCIRTMAVEPDSYEVQFGIKLNAQAGAIIAKASAEANFTVKLNWTRRRQD